ncbi:MAG: hypothetical protein GY810_25005 [Aureispira sp.]|nr:hypothetical protein [Aureispira sp.]
MAFIYTPKVVLCILYPKLEAKMDEPIERLQNLDTEKLMDVVKNYRQYGYALEWRDAAISILKERGLDEEHLKLTGNLENHSYTRAEAIYENFRSYSKLTLMVYILSWIVYIGGLLIQPTGALGTVLMILNIGLFVGFLYLLLQSFLTQNQFYKAINQNYGPEGAVIYLVLGMPLYLLLYFYFAKQMKEKMQSIV